MSIEFFKTHILKRQPIPNESMQYLGFSQNKNAWCIKYATAQYFIQYLTIDSIHHWSK